MQNKPYGMPMIWPVLDHARHLIRSESTELLLLASSNVKRAEPAETYEQYALGQFVTFNSRPAVIDIEAEVIE